MMKFTEAVLEQAIIELLSKQGYPHVIGANITRDSEEVLIKEDLRQFLSKQYASDQISEGEIHSIISKLEAYPSSDL